MPKEALKEWEEMQKNNNNEIEICTTRYNEYDAQCINLQEQLIQLASNLQ
ncbi:hypothetical protein [Candidatus Rickettsia colombianensi]|nr:hypothetical protein [Candidatus Rickettsia colombianensi]